MKPMTMIAAVVAGLSFVATASTFAQDRAKQAEPARRPAERPVQNDDAKRRAEADRTKTADRPAATRTATEDERRRAEAGGDKTREKTMTEDERRKAAERTDADKDLDKRRAAFERTRNTHQRDVTVRTAKLQRLRAIATEKNDKEMLSRIERLEAQQRELDQRRRASLATEEAELKRGEPAREPAREPTREPSRDGK